MGSRGVGGHALVGPGKSNEAKHGGLQIIFEGGHRGNEQHKRGLKEFLDKVSPDGHKIKVVLGFGRVQAAGSFLDRVKKGANAFLLIDAEGPLTAQSISTVIGPELAAYRDRVFFMVQVMESWFIADSNALVDVRNAKLSMLTDELNRYGGNIEGISKPHAQALFAKATDPHLCSAENGKGLRLSYLAKIDPEKLRKASPEAARLIRTAENSWVPLPEPPAKSQKAPDLDDVGE
jgi:hypothetical protein